MYIKKATHHFENSIKSSTKIMFLSLDILSNSLYNASQTSASQSVFTEKKFPLSKFIYSIDRILPNI